MGIAAIGNKRVNLVDHAVGHIRMQIDGSYDGHQGANDGPRHFEDEAVRVILFGGDGSAMFTDIDGVQRQSGT